MENTEKETIITLLEQSIKKNWEYPALSNMNGASYQYRALARKIAKLHLLFEHAGIQRGDRIALCGRNSAHWSVAFTAILTYGAVAVPILHEFKPDNVHHLVNHSDAKLFFVDTAIWENLEPDVMQQLLGVINIANYSLLMSRSERLNEARANLNRLFGEKYPERFTPEDVHYAQPEDDNAMAVLNYTSGSMGFSKGVMLSYRSLWSNVRFGIDNIDCKSGDGVVCMLPLAHMFGVTFEMIHMLCRGCHINFLTRTPSPRVIMEAFATVKPKVIITVPLIIEKIIKTRVFPKLEKPVMKMLLHVPYIDDKLLGKIKDKLTEVFGGRLEDMIIGGAALNGEVEAFLRRIKFPFTVGYGMTECGPLITYAPWNIQRSQSCGKIVDRMEARIDSHDPLTTPGVLWVRGENMMLGYYKNPEATAETIIDGWMNTGDICQRDADGFFYIRGRNKSMILGPGGQNIYPEEIEQKVNNMPYVNESLVVDRGGKLMALIHPDFDAAATANISQEALEVLMNENIKQVNTELPGYSQISSVKLYQEEFEKTPKRSIKRYLYKD